MKLSERQQLHSQRLGLLLNYLPVLSLETGNKYTVAIADAQSRPGNKPKHKPGSFHFIKCATDIDLFINGIYQKTTKAHEPLGKFWVAIGGTWGGNFKKPDGNHYSSFEVEKTVDDS